MARNCNREQPELKINQELISLHGLHPTPNFEKLFTGVKVQPRRRAQMDRAISMINALHPTFLEIDSICIC